MSKPKVIFLTSVGVQLTEKGLEKFRREEDFEEDSNPVEGSPAWFRKMGINPPKDLEKEDESKIQEEDFDYVYGEVLLDLNDYSYINYSDVNQTCYVYTKSGGTIAVLETAEQIYQQLYDLKANFFEKIIDKIKIRFRKNDE